MIDLRFSGAEDLVAKIREGDQALAALVVRLDAAEDVIRAAKTPGSIAKIVAAVDVYEEAYGPVVGEYGSRDLAGED